MSGSSDTNMPIASQTAHVHQPLPGWPDFPHQHSSHILTPRGIGYTSQPALAHVQGVALPAAGGNQPSAGLLPHLSGTASATTSTTTAAKLNPSTSVDPHTHTYISKPYSSDHPVFTSSFPPGGQPLVTSLSSSSSPSSPPLSSSTLQHPHEPRQRSLQQAQQSAGTNLVVIQPRSSSLGLAFGTDKELMGQNQSQSQSKSTANSRNVSTPTAAASYAAQHQHQHQQQQLPPPQHLQLQQILLPQPQLPAPSRSRTTPAYPIPPSISTATANTTGSSGRRDGSPAPGTPTSTGRPSPAASISLIKGGGLAVTTAVAVSGMKLKRAFAGRRKKTDDSSVVLVSRPVEHRDSERTEQSMLPAQAKAKISVPEVTSSTSQIVSAASSLPGKRPGGRALPLPAAVASSSSHSSTSNTTPMNSTSITASSSSPSPLAQSVTVSGPPVPPPKSPAMMLRKQHTAPSTQTQTLQSGGVAIGGVAPPRGKSLFATTQGQSGQGQSGQGLMHPSSAVSLSSSSSIPARQEQQPRQASPIPPPIPPLPSRTGELPLPPPPPPPPSLLPILPPPPPIPEQLQQQLVMPNVSRASVFPVTPSVASAVSFMKMNEEKKEKELQMLLSKWSGKEGSGEEKTSLKESDVERGPQPESEEDVNRIDGSSMLHSDMPHLDSDDVANATAATATATSTTTTNATTTTTTAAATATATATGAFTSPTSPTFPSAESKAAWRKSDSTMSHHTIRPSARNAPTSPTVPSNGNGNGTGSGARSSRPVSMAESLQSNYTIVPPSKRQSALITDADFGMAEEDDDGDGDDDDDGFQHVGADEDGWNASEEGGVDGYTDVGDWDRERSREKEREEKEREREREREALMKSRNRRSMSLNVGGKHGQQYLGGDVALDQYQQMLLLQQQQQRSRQNISNAPIAYPSLSFSEGVSVPMKGGSTTLTRADAKGFIASSSSHQSSNAKNVRHHPNASSTSIASSSGPSHTGHNFRGRLAAWASGSNSSHNNHATNNGSSKHERNLPALPQDNAIVPTGKTSGSPGFRQTAISMTSGFAPAAGLAKRAVEKMGKALGNGFSSSSPASSTMASQQQQQQQQQYQQRHQYSNSSPMTFSGYHTSSSTTTASASTPPSSFSGSSSSHHHGSGGFYGEMLARTGSNQSLVGNPGAGVGKHRKTPNASSGGWSVPSAAASTSSVVGDGAGDMVPSGPNLGKRMRGPLRFNRTGGVVFGRELKIVAKETPAVFSAPRSGLENRWEGLEVEVQGKEKVLRVLETRKLPALVVRCAQHLLIWGVQEEGLFRVSGRPSHATKIRTEFDTGADFDMTACNPGELDPHSVAGVFRAFLRELPEPLLTHALGPYFEASISQEASTNAAETASHSAATAGSGRAGARGPGLPTNPRGNDAPAMRKPPSLSTLAMPTFSGLPPPSKQLISAFTLLIGQLPQENRDLLRTVVDIIRETASRSKQTKMPLNNLLLVFCPSMNMNPPLLRLLCEAEAIWGDEEDEEDEDDEGRVLDIRRRTVIAPTPAPLVPSEDEVFSDAEEGLDESSGGDLADSSSASDAQDREVKAIRRRTIGTRRTAVSTVYMDADSAGEDWSSPEVQGDDAGSRHVRRPSATASNDGRSIGDDSSYVSTSEGNSLATTDHSFRPDAPSPGLSSSAESLATPISSGRPSFDLANSNGSYDKPQPSGSPIIAESAPLSIQSPQSRKYTISSPILITGPVQFPTSPEPPSTSTKSKRRSVPILSLPNMLSSNNSDSPSTPDSSDSGMAGIARRLKKPSLHLLFSKRSVSSLSSSSPGGAGGRNSMVLPASAPTQNHTPPLYGNNSSGKHQQIVVIPPYSAVSDSSVSTPISAVTAPQSGSTTTLPPALDTAIETTSWDHGLGTALNSGLEQRQQQKSDVFGMSGEAERRLKTSANEVRATTPFSEWYQKASESSASLAKQDGLASSGNHLRPYPVRTRKVSSNGSSHLSLLGEDEPEEDWTKSVLIAADIGRLGS